MPLCKLLNFSLGHLRARLAERKTARAAKKAGNLRRKRDSAGPKSVTLSLSPTTEVFEERKVKFPEQPSLSPRTTVRVTAAASTKAIFTTTFASQMKTLIIAPTSNEAAVHLGFLEGSPISTRNIQIGVIPLSQPWFSRRRSSLMRISASNLQMSDSVRSPRRSASRTHEYIPLALDDLPVSSEGIEMEMDDFSPGWKKNSLQASSEDLVDADDDASILTFEQVSFLAVHRADPFRFASSMVSVSRDLPVPVTNTTSPKPANSNTASNNTEPNKEIPTPNILPGPKLRPAPLPLSSSTTKSDSHSNSDSDSIYEPARLTQPLPVQDHFCIISDSPVSFQSFDMIGSWPGTPILTPADGRRTILFWTVTGNGSARSSVSIIRPGTAGSGGSEYRSVWW